jgi:hypothetical protein
VTHNDPAAQQAERIQPVVVDVHVREIFEDLDGDLPYERAARALYDRWIARGRHPDADEELASLSDQRAPSDRAACDARPWTVGDELLAWAIFATPLPAQRHPPLPRLGAHGARLDAAGAERSRAATAALRGPPGGEVTR